MALLAPAVRADPADGVEKHYSADYRACMARGLSTYEMKDCIAAEQARWDTQLNARYQALMKSLPPDRAAALRARERSWLAGRRRTCDHAGDSEAGGTAQGVEVDACYMDETIRRTLFLKDYG